MVSKKIMVSLKHLSVGKTNSINFKGHKERAI